MIEFLVKCPVCQVESLPLAEDETSCVIRCPICGRKGVIFMVIKVVKISRLPGPLKFRQAWLEIETLAECKPLPASLALPQGGYAVSKIIALAVLRNKSAQVAEWFKLHYPADQMFIVFAADEVEVIEGVGVFDDEPPASFRLRSFN